MPDQHSAGKGRENLAQTLLEYLRKRYKERSNPYFAIQAYQISRDIGIELPDWVQSYVFEAFDKLADLYSHYALTGAKRIHDKIEKSMTSGNFAEFSKLSSEMSSCKSEVDPTAQMIKQALGLSTSGRGSCISAAAKHLQAIRLAEHVHIQLNSTKLDFAYDFTAKRFGVCRSKVQRAYSEFKDIVDPIT